MHATWVHGHAVVAEHPADGALQQVDGRPWTDIVGYRTGWGATYRGTGDWNKTDTWFHIPIPTPVILTDRRLFVDRFFLLFTAQNIAGVAQVHIWNGPNRLWTNADAPTWPWDSTHPMAGDFSTIRRVGPDEHGRFVENVWTPRTRDGGRFWFGVGLGLSVLVHFGRGDSQICFHAAGADWTEEER